MDATNDAEDAGIIEPVRIVTDWRRFACGLWRLPQGDISAAYCADIFPKLKVFTHEGRSFMNGGNCFSGVIKTNASCYPLIPKDEYTGPDSVRYSYEGKEGCFQGRPFRLGPKIIFEANDPTVDEWALMLRILYADGGGFTHGVTYEEFLTVRHVPKSENERIAHAEELNLCECAQMPETQEDMRLFLDDGVPVPDPNVHRQLELTFF